ncbi:winged helix-turn-helix domain-containing protein [Edaphobacter aggregans]|uniref:winged helix-turn-helix domain-containing protein n=1 Tax=Edaphobacter aggregans TaxID=570835 RepID=UPI003917E5F7
MLPVLTASAKGEVRIGLVVEELADQLGLTLEERSELLPSGKQTIFSNRAHWAKSYLSKAHLIDITRRGHFRISPRGQKLIETNQSRSTISCSCSLRSSANFGKNPMMLATNLV